MTICGGGSSQREGMRWAESWEQRALAYMHMFKKSGDRKPLRRSGGKGKGRGEFLCYGGERRGKVNDAGKDDLRKKRKKQMYRGKMNFKRFFFLYSYED